MTFARAAPRCVTMLEPACSVPQEMAVVPCLAAMEANGVRFQPQVLEKVQRKFEVSPTC